MPGNRFKTNGFRMCLEALQASELFTEISFIDLHGTKFPLFRKNSNRDSHAEQPQTKTAGSPEPGLPALNLNATDGYENQLSATAEIINTSSAKGTATLTLKVKPSLFTCVNISTEISEFFDCIASAPLIDFGSTVLSSWAVAVLRGRNEHPYRLSSLSGNPRRESYTADNDLFFYKQSRKSAGARLLRPESPLIPRRAFYRKPTESLSAFLAEKCRNKNRPGIEHYSLFKNNSAAAPITAKETEPSKLTTKSALTDNSLNTIRSRNSRIVSRAFTTNLLVQGLGACPRRIEPCVFLPLRKLEDFISKGPLPSFRKAFSIGKQKRLILHFFPFPRREKPCVA